MNINKKYKGLHFVKKIKLIDLEKFASMDRNTSPYIKFHKWLVAEAFPTFLYDGGNGWGLPPGLIPHVTHVFLAKEDYKKLEIIARKWAGTEPGLLGMIQLQQAPCEFPKLPNWAEPGHVYITKGFLKKREL